MILIDILEEHLEEADFLWQQRENALRDRVFELHDLAHLDGLVLAEEEGWKLVETKLSGGEVGEVFAGAKGALLEGIRHALRHTNSPEVEGIRPAPIE